MTKDPLCLAIALRDPDGRYARHAGAMVASVLTNTHRPVRLHLLHDDTLSDDDAARFQSLIAAYGQELRLHFLDPAACLPGVDETTTIMRPLTFATLYRLFLPQLVEESRILYMDTDLVADVDLGELWDLDMHGRPVGAVPDPCLCGAAGRKGATSKDQWAARVARINLSMGIPMSRYFNAGVLLLDMDAIRRNGDFAAALDLILSNPHLIHPDQDALNKVFFGRSVFIPHKFNYLLHSCDVDALTEGVWHYSGAFKPWDEETPKADRYHHYLSLTPWA